MRKIIPDDQLSEFGIPKSASQKYRDTRDGLIPEVVKLGNRNGRFEDELGIRQKYLESGREQTDRSTLRNWLKQKKVAGVNAFTNDAFEEWIAFAKRITKATSFQLEGRMAPGKKDARNG
jgi:hypothetical protein